MVCLVTGFEAQAFHQSWQPVSIGLGGRVWRILLGPCAPYSDCSLESPGTSSMHLPGRTVPFCPTTGSSHQDILFLGDLCSIAHVLPFLCFTLDLSHIFPCHWYQRVHLCHRSEQNQVHQNALGKGKALSGLSWLPTAGELRPSGTLVGFVGRFVGFSLILCLWFNGNRAVGSTHSTADISELSG